MMASSRESRFFLLLFGSSNRFNYKICLRWNHEALGASVRQLEVNWKTDEKRKRKKNIPTIPVSSFFRWNNPEEQIKAVVFTEISRSIVWERIWGLGASWQVAPFRLYPSLISIEVAYNREFRHENLTKERAYRKLKWTRINRTFITNQRTSKSIWT